MSKKTCRQCGDEFDDKGRVNFCCNDCRERWYKTVNKQTSKVQYDKLKAEKLIAKMSPEYTTNDPNRCFADRKPGVCEVLIQRDCTACTYRKTREELQNERHKAVLRINALNDTFRNYLIGKYDLSAL